MLINDYRKRLDDVDDELLRQLNTRAQIVAELGRMKAEASVEVFDAEREAKIIGRMMSRNAGPLSADAVQQLFSDILQQCRIVEYGSYVNTKHPEKQNAHRD